MSELVLSLDLTTSLITPLVGIRWPCIFGKECFAMLKSIEFRDVVRLFSSSRLSDRVYLAWFVWDSVGRLFRMQGSRQSVNARQSFGSIGSCLSFGFQFYLSKCWDPYVSPGCMTTCFLLQFCCLIWVCWSCHNVSYGWVPSLPLLAQGSVNVEHGSTRRFFEGGIWFLGSFLFSS